MQSGQINILTLPEHIWQAANAAKIYSKHCTFATYLYGTIKRAEDLLLLDVRSVAMSNIGRYDLIPFLRPRWQGKRFDRHTLPLEMLKELPVLEKIIVEIAKDSYFKNNPNRKRIPRGALSNIALELSDISEGSICLEITMRVPNGIQPALFDDSMPKDDFSPKYLENARDKVLELISNVDDPSIASEYPKYILGYFDKFGRSLKEGEELELAVGKNDSTKTVSFNSQKRKKLLELSQVDKTTDPLSLRGVVTALDKVKQIFNLETVKGENFEKIPFDSSQLAVIEESLLTYSSNRDKANYAFVLVEGIGIFSRNNVLEGFDSVEEVNFIEENDPVFQLEEMWDMEDGWHEGEGKAPSKEGLNWLAKWFESEWLPIIPNPYLFPTPDGGVMAEWFFGREEASLEIDLQTGEAEWFVYHLDTKEENERTLSLKETQDLDWLTQEIIEVNKRNT